MRFRTLYVNKLFDSLREVEHELGFDLVNLESVVSEAASDVDRAEEFELTDEDFRNMLQQLERE